MSSSRGDNRGYIELQRFESSRPEHRVFSGAHNSHAGLYTEEDSFSPASSPPPPYTAPVTHAPSSLDSYAMGGSLLKAQTGVRASPGSGHMFPSPGLPPPPCPQNSLYGHGRSYASLTAPQDVQSEVSGPWHPSGGLWTAEPTPNAGMLYRPPRPHPAQNPRSGHEQSAQRSPFSSRPSPSGGSSGGHWDRGASHATGDGDGGAGFVGGGDGNGDHICGTNIWTSGNLELSRAVENVADHISNHLEDCQALITECGDSVPCSCPSGDCSVPCGDCNCNCS
jgi:hypothetical protein